MYWFKRKIWQIKNLFKWLPIIWNQYDFDESYAIEVFKFQLGKIADYLESDNAKTVSARYNAGRIRTVLKLMDKVYKEDYGFAYFDHLRSVYGEDIFEYEFIPWKESYFTLSHKYEIDPKYESVREEIRDKTREEFLISNKKQEKAHKLLWKMIERHIQCWWD